MITTTTLKNAARAIEHDLFTDPDGANYLVKDGAILRRWEPEHSSADSFELAVSLRMHACTTEFAGFADSHDEDIMIRVAFEASDRSAYSPSHATRLAVLQCASEIGAAL